MNSFYFLCQRKLCLELNANISILISSQLTSPGTSATMSASVAKRKLKQSINQTTHGTVNITDRVYVPMGGFHLNDNNMSF